MQARQKGGTPLVRGCTTYTKAYLAKLALSKYPSIVSNDVAKVSNDDEPQIGYPSSHMYSSTKPTDLSVSKSYSILEITLVAFSPIEKTNEALKYFRWSSS